MEKENLLNRITVNPNILLGKPTIRGMRISVAQILNALANNVLISNLLKDFPELEPEDIQAALAYAAQRIEDEKVFKVEAA
ncbi:MAG: DUF433 domain-containing protein [bacterium]